MAGLWARISSTSMWSLRRTPGSLLVRNTSEVATSLWRMANPSSVVRSSARLFLPRLECSRRTWTSLGTMASPVDASPRMASPRSTCSILMTSAPQSDSSAEAAGTKVCSATSSTRTPCMTALIGGLPCLQHGRDGGASWSRLSAAGDVPEGDVAVECALPRHAEDPLADHVARHLGRPTADGGDLAHQEVGPAVGDGTVVVGPRPAVTTGDLVGDGVRPGRDHTAEESADGRRLVRHCPGAHPLGEALLERLGRQLEHPGFAD